jgi:hypothetical protein
VVELNLLESNVKNESYLISCMVSVIFQQGITEGKNANQVWMLFSNLQLGLFVKAKDMTCPTAPD